MITMKNNILLFLFVLILLAAKAQNSANCTMLINGKEFPPGSKIKKDDLVKFCPLEVKDGNSGKTIKVASVKWMIDHKGQVFKGTNPVDCSKLIQAINQMKSGDIIFIEEMRFKEFAPHSCMGQFYLTLE